MKEKGQSLFLAAWLLAGSLTLGAAWTSVRLTNTTGTSANPEIAVSGSNVYVVWQDDQWGNFEIYFRKSKDGGTTWLTAARRTNNSGWSANPRLAVNTTQVFIIREDDTPGNKEIYLKYSPL